MNPPKKLRELPNSRNHNCFGCSPANPSGLQMKFLTDGEAVYSQLEVPEHLCGWSNIVHGGVLTTILDEIMSWSAIHLLKRIALTRTLTVEFLKPVPVGRSPRPSPGAWASPTRRPFNGSSGSLLWTNREMERSG